MNNGTWEPMLDEIRSQQEYLLSCYREAVKQAERIIDPGMAAEIKKIYITGCGDSYYAGKACRMFFRKYAGIEAEAVQALEFSRYVMPAIEPGSIVAGISNSGEVARTIESVIRAGKAGAMTLAVTADTESRLAEAAESLIEVRIPSSYGKLPGTRSYMGSITCLMGLAAAIGLKSGVISRDEAGGIEKILNEVAASVHPTVESSLVEIEGILGVERAEQIQIVGSGPNQGTAEFGAMKILEAAGMNSQVQGTEEWAHTLYFSTKPGTLVFLIAAEGKSLDRSLEILPAVKTVGGKSVVIAEEGRTDVLDAADYRLSIKGVRNLPEEFSGLLYILPLEILAFQLAVLTGATPMGFNDNPEKKEMNFRQIRGSEILV